MGLSRCTAWVGDKYIGEVISPFRTLPRQKMAAQFPFFQSLPPQKADGTCGSLFAVKNTRRYSLVTPTILHITWVPYKWSRQLSSLSTIFWANHSQTCFANMLHIPNLFYISYRFNIWWNRTKFWGWTIEVFLILTNVLTIVFSNVFSYVLTNVLLMFWPLFMTNVLPMFWPLFFPNVLTIVFDHCFWPRFLLMFWPLFWPFKDFCAKGIPTDQQIN